MVSGKQKTLDASSFLTPVTVLMTVYNNAKYLREAVESILAQTFRDFEFLIIDDGSRDDSVEIIRGFNDRRIRLIVQEKNGGQTQTLNLGLKLARGRYIARMDADDIALPERLEKQFAFAQSAGPDFAAVGTGFVFVDSLARPIYSPQLALERADMIWRLLFTSPLAHPSVLMAKEAVLGVGGYDTTFRYMQDQILWIRLLKKGFQIHNL